MSDEVEIEVKEEEVAETKVDPRIAQDNITPDMPRFKEVYKNMKELERKMAERDEKDVVAESLITEMRGHNERLAKAIEASVDVTREAVTGRKDKDAEDEILDSLSEQLAELKEKKKTAMKAFDYDVTTELDEQMMEVKLEINEVKKAKGGEGNTKKVSQDDKIDPAFISFVEETPWFNGDTADVDMIRAAYEMDKVLIRDTKWSKTSVSDRLAEVRKRIEAKYEWKNEENTSARRRKPGSVEGVNMTQHKGTKVVKLSVEQLAVAKGFGITPEAYARQVMALGGE